MDDNCRPDLICKEVNEIGKHLSSEDWDKIASDFRREKERKINSKLETQKRISTDAAIESSRAVEEDDKRARSSNVAGKLAIDQKSSNEWEEHGDLKVGAIKVLIFPIVLVV